MKIWALISELRPELLAYARTLSDSHVEAEDLVADAVERFARARSVPSEKTALRFWMFRTIRNLSIDELRKRRVRREYSEHYGRILNATVGTELGVEDATFLRLAIAKLTANEREILFLIDVMGMKYAEAADMMHVPVGTVMSRISRARRTLLEKLGADKLDRKRRGDRVVRDR